MFLEYDSETNLLPKKIAAKLYLLSFYIKTCPTKGWLPLWGRAPLWTLMCWHNLLTSSVSRVRALLNDRPCVSTISKVQMFHFFVLCAFIWVTSSAETWILSIWIEISGWSKITCQKKWFKFKIIRNLQLIFAYVRKKMNRRLPKQVISTSEWVTKQFKWPS